MKHLEKSWGKRSRVLVQLILVAVMVVALLSTAIGGVGAAGEETEALQSAPLNPDFEAYWENPPGTSYGYIPTPMDLSHLRELSIQEAQASASALPTSFDWRDTGKVTSVKDQKPCGTCWVFGTTSVLESAVLIGESVEYDFSEQSVALCVDRSWVYMYDDPWDPCDAGGNSFHASEVFIRKGSVLESCNPYDPAALNCDGACVCDDCPAIKKVDGYRYVTGDGSEIGTIKDAVSDEAPVTMAFYYHSDYEYWDPTWGAIYDCYPCSASPNHLVSIVGWDDDVPHPDPDHAGTGAWIIKNSWGPADSWAGGAGVSDGYFYLAYDSSCVTEIAYLEYKDPVPGEELLYWDEAGPIFVGGYGDNTAWMASVFTAAQSGDLTHVDFWTTSNNTEYEIYVWNGFFGAELGHQTGSCQEAGYYSIPLSDPISMAAGQQFTVGAKMTTPGYDYPIPMEAEISDVVEPPIQSNVSFVRHTVSDSWEDLADYDWNACLRARIVGEVPDIYVDPPSFDVTLTPDTTWNGTLEIGNDGSDTLTYSITDVETTTAPGASLGELGLNPESEERVKNPEPPQANGVSLLEELDRASRASATQETPLVAAGETEIAYDDGSAEDGYSISDVGLGSVFAVCFTPPEYPVKLKTARFFVVDYGIPTTPIKIHVYEQATGSSAPGAELITPFIVTPPGPGWFDVDLSGYGIVIGSGSFAIGEEPTVSYSVYLGEDQASPDYRSWFYNISPAVWHNFAEEISPGDLMIRAIVETVEDCPWLDEDPKSGSVPPGSYDDITVTIDTTGLALGEYSAEIWISNNDPDENPTIVPVQLTVKTAVAGVAVSINAPAEVAEGADFTARVEITYVEKFSASDFVVTFDSTVLEFIKCTNGELDGQVVTADCNPLDTGKIKVLAIWAPLYPGINGEGYLVDLHFHVIGTSCQTSPIDLSEGKIANEDMQPIEATWVGASVHVVAVVSIDAPPEVAEGSDFTARVEITYVEKFAAGEFVVTFDSTVLEFIECTNGELDGQVVTADCNPLDTGKIKVLAIWAPLYPGINGEGYLVDLHFHVIGTSCQTSPIDLSEGKIANEDMQPIEATWVGASVHVFTPGDADCDGDVDVFDLVKVKRIILGVDDPTPGADADLDGDVDVFDLVKVKRIILGIVSYATYTHPEKGYSFDYPEDWQEVAFEDILMGIVTAPSLVEDAAAQGITVDYVVGWQSPTGEDGYYPNMNIASYGLPVTFPPEGFWNVQQENFATVFPCCPTGPVDFPPRVISAGEARTITEDRMCWLATFTWTMCEEYVEDADPFECTKWTHDLQTMMVIVTKGITYMMTCTTTQDTWDQYEDIFEHICLSFVTPQ